MDDVGAIKQIKQFERLGKLAARIGCLLETTKGGRGFVLYSLAKEDSESASYALICQYERLDQVEIALGILSDVKHGVIWSSRLPRSVKGDKAKTERVIYRLPSHKIEDGQEFRKDKIIANFLNFNMSDLD